MSHFDVTVGPWFVPREQLCYRSIPATAAYDAGEPWAGRGRFGDGAREVLYTASTSEAALAEYFRRHPELLELQDASSLRIYELQISAEDPGVLDLRLTPSAVAVGIDPQRLVSSDLDEDVRYRECRELGIDVDAMGGAGIAHLSAALSGGDWTMAMFGSRGGRWTAAVMGEVKRPKLDPARVQVLA